MRRFAFAAIALAACGPARRSEPVEPISETTILCEAEEFQVAVPGWQPRPYGTNYYVGTFANTFLSRKAYLGAPEQGARSTASIDVRVPTAGRYLALVRYESVYRYETQFRLVVEQSGKTKLDRLYGARENLKIWAFHQKLKSEVAWSWGATENIVWEGHDAAVELEAGPARLTLVADRQPGLAARRNVDCILLTRDVEDVKHRIEKENYLPLDGLLTQAGDLFLKLHATEAMTVVVPNGTEHSPYWVHLRTWKPKTLTAAAGTSTDWVEVGSLLDSLNDGQWTLTVKGRGALEFGAKGGDGKIEPIRRFDGVSGALSLAYDADTRTSRRIRESAEVLYDLVDYLKKQPVHGTPPKRTYIHGYTFDARPDDAKYAAAREEFVRLIGAPRLIDHDGYIDVRGRNPQQLEEVCAKLKAEGRAEKMAIVSLGDEIGLAAPPANDHESFRAWLKERDVKPADLGIEDGETVVYSPVSKEKPGLYYYSRLYKNRYGIRAQKALTDVLRKHLPNAGIGANFSPHHGHVYLGETHQWISLFREGGMTMPWGEDYIFQMPVATHQMNSLQIDMFRAGIKGRPEAKIHMYVMPHWPGNTPESWRRMWYGAIAHGVKVFNLFEFRPVQAAYTENHVSLPAMYQEVRRAIHELGTFEDIVQDGQVRSGVAALWFSEAADIWDDNRPPFDAAKRCLYIMRRHAQVPIDVVVEGDDLAPYKELWLTDRHVSRAASKTIADWVRAGGLLYATAGAGMFDELNRPNTILRELLGVVEQQLDVDPEPVVLEKQDLPYAKFLANAAYGAISRITLKGAEAREIFPDGSPAVAANGRAMYFAYLPGLNYFAAAIPRRPVDRGHEGSMAHLIPVVRVPALLNLPVVCSEQLVETTIIRSPHGTAIPLINWSGGPVRDLKVTVNIDVPTKSASRASGKPVTREGRVFKLDLDVADALILR